MPSMKQPMAKRDLWHAQSGEHDVIVLDLMLPKIDGLTVLKTLREKSCPR